MLHHTAMATEVVLDRREYLWLSDASSLSSWLWYMYVSLALHRIPSKQHAGRRLPDPLRLDACTISVIGWQDEFTFAHRTWR
jgi:hypothetical protein